MNEKRVVVGDLNLTLAEAKRLIRRLEEEVAIAEGAIPPELVALMDRG